MPHRSPLEALAVSLKRLKAPLPSGFVPDPGLAASPLLQQFAASGLTAIDTFDAEVKGRSFTGVFALKLGTGVATVDGRTWTPVARMTDVHAELGVFDAQSEDPMVHAADVEDLWDDHRNAPRPGGARPLCTLSELVAKLKRRPIEKASKAAVAELLPLEWTASMPCSRYTPLMASGPAALGRARLAVTDGEPERDGVSILGVDGSVETLALQATHSTYLGDCAWAGDAIVVLGHRRNKLTHVGLLERHGGRWVARELWAQDPDAPGALRVTGNQLSANAHLLAYCTEVEKGSADALIHVWRRDGDDWTSAGTMQVPGAQRLFVDGADRIWSAEWQGLREIRLEHGGLRDVGRVAMPSVAAVCAGADFMVSPTFLGSTLERWREGQRVQALGLARKVSVQLAERGGLLVAALVPEAAHSKQSTLLGWRRDASGACVRAFELQAVSLDEGHGRYAPPERIALSDGALFLGYGHLGLRRLVLPA